MRTPRIRGLLTFSAGFVAALAVAGLLGAVGSVSASTRYDDLSLFTSVLNHVRRNYVEDVDERTLVHGAVRGMLEELDPHSSFLDPAAYREMQVDTKGEFHGLGIEITASPFLVWARGVLLARYVEARSDAHDAVLEEADVLRYFADHVDEATTVPDVSSGSQPTDNRPYAVTPG